MSKEQEGRLAENIVYFARALRAAGIPLGPRSVIDALDALQAAGIGTRDDFYWTLHAVFVKRHEHSMLFDQAFRIFFRKRAYLERLMSMLMPQVETPGEEHAPPPASQRVLDALFAGIGEKIERRKSEIEIDARLTMSDREILEKKDFAQMSAAEIAEAKQAIKRLALPLNEVKTRRLAPSAARPHDRYAPHIARQHESRRRGDRPEISWREDAPAADRRLARYFRLDEPVHAAVPAFPARRHGCAQTRLDLPVRHAAHQRDARLA